METKSDRKLQTLSLLKYSQISVKEIDQAAKEAPNPNHIEGMTAKSKSFSSDLQLTLHQ